MHESIVLLTRKINGLQPLFFAPGASAAAIRLFEESTQIQLPQTFKALYQLTNGGFFPNSGGRDTDPGDDGELDHMRWNSNYLLSLEDMMSACRDEGLFSTAFDLGEEQKRCGKRLLPVLHTAAQEHYIVDATNLFESSPVYYALHEVGMNEWEKVYDSFEALITAFAEREGKILWWE